MRLSTVLPVVIILHITSGYARRLTKQLTYESQHSGNGYIRDGCLLISGLRHPCVHQRPQLIAVRGKWKALAQDYSGYLLKRVSSLNTASSRKTNIPQNIVIGPLPLFVRTKEVQGEDMFPSLGAQVVSEPAVFSERQAWPWPDIRQRSGDQLVNVTGRTLQRDREIRSCDAHYTWLGTTLIWKLVETRCDKDSKLGLGMLEISVWNKNNNKNVLH